MTVGPSGSRNRLPTYPQTRKLRWNQAPGSCNSTLKPKPPAVKGEILLHVHATSILGLFTWSLARERVKVVMGLPSSAHWWPCCHSKGDDSLQFI